MKTINLPTKISTIEELLELAKKENVILKTADGQEFILAEIDEFDREVELVRYHQELMDLLDQRSGEKERYTLKQIREQLHLAENCEQG